MNEMQVFQYENNEVRTVEQNGEVWWVLADVCRVLGVKNPTDVRKRLDEDERARFNLGRQGEANIISESGLYKVILRSDKPEAKKFTRWVTHEVLPTIRRTGGIWKPECRDRKAGGTDDTGGLRYGTGRRCYDSDSG